MPVLGTQTCCLFQRWLWVQFPWMALSGSGVNLSPEATAATSGAAAAEFVSSGGDGAPPAMSSSSADSQGGGKDALPDKSRRREAFRIILVIVDLPLYPCPWGISPDSGHYNLRAYQSVHLWPNIFSKNT